MKYPIFFHCIAYVEWDISSQLQKSAYLYKPIWVGRFFISPHEKHIHSAQPTVSSTILYLFYEKKLKESLSKFLMEVDFTMVEECALD